MTWTVDLMKFFSFLSLLIWPAFKAVGGTKADEDSSENQRSYTQAVGGAVLGRAGPEG